MRQKKYYYFIYNCCVCVFCGVCIVGVLLTATRRPPSSILSMDSENYLKVLPGVHHMCGLMDSHTLCNVVQFKPIIPKYL